MPKEDKNYDDLYETAKKLNNQWNNLILKIANELKINMLVGWLIKQLNKINRSR